MGAFFSAFSTGGSEVSALTTEALAQIRASLQPELSRLDAPVSDAVNAANGAGDDVDAALAAASSAAASAATAAAAAAAAAQDADDAASGQLTAQQIRDAMALALSTGTAIEDTSLDDKVAAAGTGLGVIALPATARLPLGESRRGSRLEIPEGGGLRQALYVFDAFDTAITDLDERVLEFVVFTEAKVLKIQIDDTAIDRDAGDPENGVAPFLWLTLNAGAVPSGQYRWQLWDITNTPRLDLGSGVFVIRPAVSGV